MLLLYNTFLALSLWLCLDGKLMTVCGRGVVGMTRLVVCVRMLLLVLLVVLV